MTREEAIEILDRFAHHSHSEVVKYPRQVAKEAFEMAIAALKAAPCEDAVSREAVINAFPDIPIVGYNHACIAEIVKSLPPVTPKPRLIPVSERLPKEHLCDDGYVEPSDYVLVCGDYGNYGVSRYWGNRRSKAENPNTCKDWVDLDWPVQSPKAWMPLPEPYKEGESE